jgi:hypothetical protein
MLERRVPMDWICQGCNARVRVVMITTPGTSGAMTTVDCPVCGASKMITDEALSLFYLKDGNWIEVPVNTPRPY